MPREYSRAKVEAFGKKMGLSKSLIDKHFTHVEQLASRLGVTRKWKANQLGSLFKLAAKKERVKELVDYVDGDAFDFQWTPTKTFLFPISEHLWDCLSEDRPFRLSREKAEVFAAAKSHALNLVKKNWPEDLGLLYGYEPMVNNIIDLSGVKNDLFDGKGVSVVDAEKRVEKIAVGLLRTSGKQRGLTPLPLKRFKGLKHTKT